MADNPDLIPLIVPKTRTQWSFVQMLKGLFPRGPIWDFEIEEEAQIVLSGIESNEAWGTITLSGGS